MNSALLILLSPSLSNILIKSSTSVSSIFSPMFFKAFFNSLALKSAQKIFYWTNFYFHLLKNHLKMTLSLRDWSKFKIQIYLSCWALCSDGFYLDVKSTKEEKKPMLFPLQQYSHFK